MLAPNKGRIFILHYWYISVVFLSKVLAYLNIVYFFLKLEERRQNLAATAG